MGLVLIYLMSTNSMRVMKEKNILSLICYHAVHLTVQCLTAGNAQETRACLKYSILD